jgi:uroporphyrin-III C-methyltransferase/precorrin-2 dehydrogenase/sirohydrochlorin ferrochelatase
VPVIAQILIEHGRSPETPAAAIADGTLPGQRIVSSDLVGIAAAMADAGVGPPAIIVIGEVVAVAALLRRS